MRWFSVIGELLECVLCALLVASYSRGVAAVALPSRPPPLHSLGAFVRFSRLLGYLCPVFMALSVWFVCGANCRVNFTCVSDMSAVGGGSGGGGGGTAGAGNDVAQELAEVRVKIDKLEKAIEVQQLELKAEGATAREIATALAADKQRLVELQKKENRLAEQQREQQQQIQTQGGKCYPCSLGPARPCAAFTVVVAMPGLACKVSFVTL